MHLINLQKSRIFRYTIAFWRFIFSGLIGYAIISQLNSNSLASDFNLVNFFSYFTIQSNILTSLVLAVSGLSLLQGKPEGRLLTLFRGACVVYMAVTGIVFAVLLSGIAAKDPYLIPWSNTMLHRLVPLLILADWLLLPTLAKLVLKDILLWFIFPALWLAYSFGRAFLTGWYPYHFLDPSQVGGFYGVSLYLVGIIFGMSLICLLILALGNFAQRFR